MGFKQSTLQLIDQTYLNGLKSGNQELLNKVYSSNYPVIERMILKNSGSTDEAKDVFQDAMMVFYKNLSKEGFSLSASISTYIYAISRRLWLKRLKEKSKLSYEQEDAAIDAFDFELVSKNPNETMLQVVELLKTKGKNCLEILQRIYFNNQSFDFIATELGYASGQVVREQKYRCIKRVREDLKGMEVVI